MKPTLTVLFLTAMLLAACGPAPTPAPTVDINATVSAMSETMVAGTLTAQPTATPQPTDTPTLSPTPTETATLLLPTSTLTATATSVPLTGSFAPAGVHGSNINAVFRVENNTRETLHVYFNGVTKPGNKPIYYEYEVIGSFNFDIAWGSYEYTVQIGTKKTITGTFGISNDDKTTMRVFDNKVIVVGP